MIKILYSLSLKLKFNLYIYSLIFYVVILFNEYKHLN